MKYLYILLFIIIFVGCNSEKRVLVDELTLKGDVHYFESKPYTGIVFDVYEEYSWSGNLKSEYGVLNGIQHGIFKEYFPNGDISNEGNYIDGQKNGLWTYRSEYEYGFIKTEEGNYKDDQRDGTWKLWLENKLTSEGSYMNGKKTGLWKRYYENGQLENEGSYMNGKRDGLFRTWYDNGQLKYELNYQKGKLDKISENKLVQFQLSERDDNIYRMIFGEETQ